MFNTNDAQSFDKVPGLFFDNGDIVISAQRSGGDAISLFKLHRKVLSIHAKALSGVLMLPAAPAGGVDVNEYFEGTPVVRLFDDPADLERFFRAMYVPSTLIFRRSMACNAADAFPLLVLADKYVADDIEFAIEFQLRQEWPKDVNEWDAFESRAVQMHRMHAQTCGGGGRGLWDELIPEPASYIRLARIAKVSERTRLGGAFYQLSRISFLNDWETKTVSGVHRDATAAELAKTRRAMWSVLSEDELRRLEKGKARLAKHMGDFWMALPKRLGLDAKCAEGWWRMAPVECDDVLAALLGLCGRDAMPGVYMCGACRTRVGARARAEREVVWSKLPDYFEVCANERAWLD